MTKSKSLQQHDNGNYVFVPKKSASKISFQPCRQKTYPILGMETGMNDPIHVQVEVIIFQLIRVRHGRVNRNLHIADHLYLFFYHINHRQRVLIRQPAVKRRDSHGESITPHHLHSAKINPPPRSKKPVAKKLLHFKTLSVRGDAFPIERSTDTIRPPTQSFSGKF